MIVIAYLCPGRVVIPRMPSGRPMNRRAASQVRVANTGSGIRYTGASIRLIMVPANAAPVVAYVLMRRSPFPPRTVAGLMLGLTNIPVEAAEKEARRLAAILSL